MSYPDSEAFSYLALEHAIHPRKFGALSTFDGHARVTGPCGDTMEYWLVIRDGKVCDVSFITDGCGSSRACGSMAVCLALGRNLDELMSLQAQDVLNALGAFPSAFAHCALLAVTVLKSAVEDYLRGHGGRRESDDLRGAQHDGETTVKDDNENSI